MSRTFSLMLAIAFMFIGIPAYADTAKNPQYDEAVNLTVDMGLLTFDDIDVNSYIQRRDIAEVVAKSMGAGSEPLKPVNTVFDDVKKDDAKSGYIQRTAELNVLNGYIDGSFRPFNHVTYNQAVKSLMCMIGYDVYAEQSGGYPVGYIIAANGLGIFKGVSNKGDNNITLGEFCYMLQSVLEVDILQQISYGENSEYRSVKGKTLLTEKLDILTIEGQITTNYFTSLTGESTLRKRDVIEVNGEFYKTDKSDLPSQLGKELVFYIKDGNEKRIIAYKSKPSKNDELTFLSEDINSIDSKTIMYTDDNGKRYTAKIHPGADLIYNGCAKFAWDESDLPLVNGEIRLLDPDGDRIYDIVFANKYVNLIAEKYIAEDDIIQFNTNQEQWKSFVLKEDDDVKYELKNKEGLDIKLEDVKKWDILSVAKSLNGRVYLMRLSNDTVAGTCTEMGTDCLKINDEEYKLDFEMDSSSPLGKIKIGVEGVFYLDFTGRVVAVNYDEAGFMKYAYLMKIEKSAGIGGDVKVKLFTGEGKFEIFTLRDKVSFDDINVSADTLLNSSKIVFSNETINQLIAYEINDEGKISVVKTAENGSIYDKNDRINHFTLDDTLTSVMYRHGNMRMLASRYILNDNTKIFIIPADITDEDNFRVIRSTALSTSKTLNNVKIYDSDADCRIAAITIEYGDFMFETTIPTIGVVAKVSKGVNDDGEYLTKFTVVSGTTDRALSADADFEAIIEGSAIVDFNKESVSFVNKTIGAYRYVDADKIKVGDVIQYINDPAGKLSTLLILYREGSGILKEVMGSGTVTKDNVYASKYYTFAKITDIIDNGVKLIVPSPTGADMYERVFPFVSGTTFVKYDSQTNTAYRITRDQLKVDDTVFLHAQATNVRLVTVYE